MDANAMWELNTELLQGRGLSFADFLIRANIVRKSFESKRAWRRLITCDTSNTSTPADTYLTRFNLPTGFVKPLVRNALVLTDAAGNPYKYREIPFEQAISYKDTAGVFFFDHKNRQYGLCGKVPTTLTHNLYHTTYSDALALAADVWFFSDYDAYIPYEVAARYQLGEDYDDINARNANANASVANGVYRDAVKEDDALQRSALGV